MGNKLYVGNLPYSVRDSDLEQAFGQFGAVTSAKVMMERETGRSKGFGFVEMGSDAEAQAAITGMNGQPLGGRSVVVNEARPMESRPPRTWRLSAAAVVMAAAVVAAVAVVAAAAVAAAVAVVSGGGGYGGGVAAAAGAMADSAAPTVPARAAAVVATRWWLRWRRWLLTPDPQALNVKARRPAGFFMGGSTCFGRKLQTGAVTARLSRKQANPDSPRSLHGSVDLSRWNAAAAGRARHAQHCGPPGEGDGATRIHR